MPETLLVIGMLAVAAFVQGYCGFGFGIAAMSLLALLQLPMTGVATTVTITGVAVILLLLLLTHSDSHIRWRRGLLLLGGIAVGQPLGYWFIHSLGEHGVFRVALGLTLIAFAVNGILSPHIRRRVPAAVAIGIGVISGFLGGAFCTGGPPTVLYLYSQADDPRDMKATVQFVFVSGMIYRLILIGIAGDYSREILAVSFYALPIAIPVLIAAHALSKRASVDLFRRVVYSLIGLSGLVILARGIMLWKGA